jgi:hypothetical protein
LPSIPQKKKWPFVVAGLLIFLAAVSAFYMWFTIPTDSRRISGTGAATVQRPPSKKEPVETKEQQITQVEIQEQGVTEVVTEERGISETEPSVQEAPLSPNESELPVSPETEEEPKKAERAVSKPAEIQTQAEEKPQTEAPPSAEKAEKVTLRLKGNVTERTWLSISIDGLKAKEYTFGPSDTPEWEAEKGFELLIGNAGGITLEFNGKKLDNLGKQGQVVRIRLPKNEERSPEKN